MKRQPTEWEKLSVSHVFGKEVDTSIYKELSNLNNKKIAQLKTGKGPWLVWLSGLSAGL